MTTEDKLELLEKRLTDLEIGVGDRMIDTLNFARGLKELIYRFLHQPLNEKSVSYSVHSNPDCNCPNCKSVEEE